VFPKTCISLKKQAGDRHITLSSHSTQKFSGLSFNGLTLRFVRKRIIKSAKRPDPGKIRHNIRKVHYFLQPAASTLVPLTLSRESGSAAFGDL